MALVYTNMSTKSRTNPGRTTRSGEMDHLLEGTSAKISKLYLLSPFNATSSMETLFCLNFMALSIYLWVCIVKSYDISFDPLVVVGLSSSCMFLVFLWFLATAYNFNKYVRNKESQYRVNKEHYNPIFVHLCFAALVSAKMMMLSVIYYTRYRDNSNAVEKLSGSLIETMILVIPTLLLPVEISMYYSNSFVHRNPIPYIDVQSLYA